MRQREERNVSLTTNLPDDRQRWEGSGEWVHVPGHLQRRIVHLEHRVPSLPTLLASSVWTPISPTKLHERAIRVEDDEVKVELLDQVELHLGELRIVPRKGHQSHLCARL